MADTQTFPIITARVCTGQDPNNLSCTMPVTHIYADLNLVMHENLEDGINGTPTWMIQTYSTNTVHESMEYREFVSYEKGTALFRYHTSHMNTIEHPNCDHAYGCVWEEQGTFIDRTWDETIHVEARKDGESYYIIDRFLKSGFISHTEVEFEGVATWIATPLSEESYRIMFPTDEVPAKFQELIYNFEFRKNQ